MKFLKVVILTFLFVGVNNSYSAQENKCRFHACVLSCDFSIPDIYRLSKLKDNLLQIDLCFFPELPKSIDEMDIDYFLGKNITLKVVDNNYVDKLLKKHHYNILIGMRILCACPPKCSCKICNEHFFRELKTCGGIKLEMVPTWFERCLSLLAPQSVVLMSGQSLRNVNSYLSVGERHYSAAKRSYDTILDTFYSYYPSAGYRSFVDNRYRDALSFCLYRDLYSLEPNIFFYLFF